MKFLTQWDLVKGEDRLRTESAPFTGAYFRFLMSKVEIPDTCCKMLNYGSQAKIEGSDLDEGWRVIDKGKCVCID